MREFEWDDKKAKANKAKHDIGFEDAKFVFDDPLQKQEPNGIVNGEERWQTTGMSKTGILLLVIHTIQENGAEIIRIISVRPAKSKERRDYERRQIQRK
jgi:uncharacterized DUF497 family protein